MTKPLLQQYREAAITAAVVLRINAYELVSFEDLTDSVRATINRAEGAIGEARAALIEVLSHDDTISPELVSDIARKRLSPDEEDGQTGESDAS